MLTKKLDKSKNIVGPVVDFFKGMGATGYQITILSCCQKFVYGCTSEIYDYIYNGRVGVYPNVLELIYMPIFNDKSVVVQLLQIDSFENEENCLINTYFSIATAMREKPATETTPTMGEILRLKGNKLKFAKDFDSKKEEICYLVKQGCIPDFGNDVEIELAENFDIYTWDWLTKPSPNQTLADIPLMEKYVPGFEIGNTDDVHNCYWIWFGSLRGDDSKIDTICAFINSGKKK